MNFHPQQLDYVATCVLRVNICPKNVPRIHRQHARNVQKMNLQVHQTTLLHVENVVVSLVMEEGSCCRDAHEHPIFSVFVQQIHTGILTPCGAKNAHCAAEVRERSHAA